MRLVLSALRAIACLGCALAVCSAGWPTYRADRDNSGFAPGPGPAGIRLEQAWVFRTNSRITSTPSVEGNVVYAGTWRGEALALDASSGALLWKTYLGANSDEVYGGPRGVIGAIALRDGVAYAASGNCTLAALDAKTGAKRWQTRICNNARNDDVFASPALAGDLVLLGVDLLADRPTDRGKEVAVDAKTGRIRWVLEPARYQGVGTGVSASCVSDDAADVAYVGTGNPLPTRDPPAGDDPGSESILAIGLATGNVQWSFGPVHPHDTSDFDFFASPNRINVGSSKRPDWIIGEGNKDATYYAVDAATGAPRWRRRIPGASGAASIIGTAAAAYGAIFVPLYDGVSGSLTALRASDGAVLWQRQTGGEYGAPVVWGKTVFTTETTGWLDEFAMGTGHPIGRYPICAPAFGRGPSVADDTLFIGSGQCLTALRRARPI